MVTSVTAAAGSAATTTPAQEPVLSDLAQATLDRLGQMHSQFQQNSDAMQAQGAAAVDGAGPGDDLARSLTSFRDTFQTAALVQNQIVQFSMATSISQSLGNNLNSFLKGA